MTLLTGGCTVASAPAVRVPLIIRDADGKLLDDCLLVSCKHLSEGEEGLGEMAMMHSRFTEPSVRQVDSGFIIHQPKLSVVTYPLGLMKHIIRTDYRYVVMKEGYAPAVIYAEELLWEGEHGTPKVVDLHTDPPPWLKDNPYQDPRWMLRDAMPRIPDRHPLRPRLSRLAQPHP